VSEQEKSAFTLHKTEKVCYSTFTSSEWTMCGELRSVMQHTIVGPVVKKNDTRRKGNANLKRGGWQQPSGATVLN